MPTVDAWFWEFTGRHTARFPRPDWPPVEAEFWEGIKSLFVRHGVTEPDADAASVALMESPPPFVDRHPEALLARVASARRSRRVGPDPDPRAEADRVRSAAEDAAARASWDARSAAERDYWRALVAARLPLMAKYPKVHELMAVAWCHDPASVIPAGPGSRPDPPDPGLVPEEGPTHTPDPAPF